MLDDDSRSKAGSYAEPLLCAPRHRPDPGAGRNAFYSDTNYQLLGRIIENVTGNSWEQEVAQRIVAPLHLSSTWPFDAAAATRGAYDSVAAPHFGRTSVRVPLAMSSVGSQGGLVSTAEDSVVFLRAFLGGELFDNTYLAELQSEWRRIFFPLRYGVGLMRYSLPRLFAGGAPSEFIGHSGSLGSVLYYAPSADLYLAGTVNQIKNRALPYQLMVRLAAVAATAE